MSKSSLELFSEPFGSTGNLGDNIRRLLGAPTLDPLQTVIRESIQNIADAAKLGVGPKIAIRIRKLSDSQMQVLKSNVLTSMPDSEQSKKDVQASLSKKGLMVMEICDFHTIGLGGPTRSDRIPLGTKNTQFINFLRNIGAARNTVQGGGTYGFGKIALYRASQCSTILVDTLPHGIGSERRIIGCHVGLSYEIPDNAMSRRYTGRHWWGVPDPQDGIVDPLTGEDAKELASALGLPDRNADQTGTSIMILDFMTEGDDLPTLGNKIIEAVLWNFWPRMMRDTPPSQRFDISLELDGTDVQIPGPEDFAPLDLFSKAMRAARSNRGNDVRSLTATRAQTKLGTLAIEKGLRSPRRRLVEEESLFPQITHHIALMRPVGLVVKYLTGVALPDERLEWAGVFVCSDDESVESAFAESEPPAHDDWIPDNLPKGQSKTLVNVALRELRAHAADMGLSAAGGSPRSQSGPPLAKLAGRMGAALEGVTGDGAGIQRVKPRGGGHTKPAYAKASVPEFVRLEATEQGAVAVFATEVRQNSNRTGDMLFTSASISVDGGKAIESGSLLPTAAVLSIRSVNGDQSATGSELSINGAEGMYEIRVQIPFDCAVIANADVQTRIIQ